MNLETVQSAHTVNFVHYNHHHNYDYYDYWIESDAEDNEDDIDNILLQQQQYLDTTRPLTVRDKSGTGGSDAVQYVYDMNYQDGGSGYSHSCDYFDIDDNLDYIFMDEE